MKSVYVPAFAARPLLATLGLAVALFAGAAPAAAQTGDDAIVAAADAFRKKDRARLSALLATAHAERHPLAQWVDYWQLTSRLNEATVPELEAFYRRWSGTYVEDRLRNDWLLELGKRRDWAALAADYPRFRMNDDREVSCYAALADHLSGKEVQATALAAWRNQRDADDGCALLGATLYDAKLLTDADAWRRARVAIEANRPRAARQAALLVSLRAGSDVSDLAGNPSRYLAALNPRSRIDSELATLALMRQAATDPDAASAALNVRWEAALPPELAAWAWAAVAKQSAIRLLPDASSHYQRASMLAGQAGVDIDWVDDTLAWKARAALRANGGQPRWQQVVQAINAMNSSEQRDPTWVYWKATALRAMAPDSSEPEAMRAQAEDMLGSIAGQLHFYGSLAAEALGQPITLPPRPLPPSGAERTAAAREPGLVRSMQLISLGLRSEGVREWNFTLRGMDDRALLAAAQLACDREIWDRCINTSDRTRGEVNMAQRFPLPHRQELLARTRTLNVDPAYVYGLIRQESRFILDARSGAGASGLMQVMPATARWTARKIGMPFNNSMINDRDMNLTLGTQYLRLALEEFEGSQLLAAAAYNAGPGRPRRWREGATLDAAIWAENVPFSETRDYVKKVLSNAVFYAARLSDPDATHAPSLRQRLGQTVGPKPAAAPSPNPDLP